MYQELRDGLSAQARMYFDQLITPAGPVPYLKHGFLINKIPDVPANMRMVPYLDTAESYEAARSSRKKSRFHPVTMQEFVEGADDTSYDTVYLSNIGGYVDPYDYRDLLGDSLRITRPGGSVIETGFIEPGASAQRIAESARHRAVRLEGASANPLVVTGSYLPRPEYGTYATIYTKEK